MSEENNNEFENEREDLISADDAVENATEEELESDGSESDGSESDVSESDGSESDGSESDGSESDEITQRAKKYGHMSKEEWVAAGKDPDQWKSPEEFDKTGKILEQIYALRHKVDQRDREIKALVDYQERTSKREYERAKSDLEQRLANSKDEMDMEAVSHYTRELTRLEDMEQNEQQGQVQQQQQAALESFKERNQHWFNERNPDLMNRAVEIDNEIKSDINNGSIKVNSLDEIGHMIEKRMSYEYPNRVLGQKTDRPQKPHVSPSQSSVNKSAVNKNSPKKAFQKLSEDHKDTYNVYKRINPDITESEFIEKLKQDGEL